MSTSAENPLLTVSGDDDAELYVLDGALETVAYGVGQIERRLPPGLYKIRAVRGGARKEQLVELRGKPVHLSLWVEEFDAIAPIMPVFGGHSGAIEDHAARAIKAGVTAAPPARKRPGPAQCGLLLLGHMAAGGDPLGRMRLFPWRRAGGRRLIAPDVPPELIGDQVWSGFFHLADPGCHVLELHDGAQWVRQAVLVAPGWETRIFVRRGADARPELSIQMAKPGSSVVYSDHYQSIEVARRALETSRPIIVRDKLINELLYGKFDNPIMGLTGLHLFLEALERRARPETASRRWVDLSDRYVEEGPDIVRTVIANLHKLLRGGGTRWPETVSFDELTEPVPADLAALEIRASRYLDPAAAPPPAVDRPPMFWASWAQLRDAPAETARHAVGRDLWTRTAFSIAAGPYFSWQPKRVSLSSYVDDAVGAAVQTAIMSIMATPLAAALGPAFQMMSIAGAAALVGDRARAPRPRTGRNPRTGNAIEIKSLGPSRRTARQAPVTIEALEAFGGSGAADLAESRAGVGRALGIPESLIKSI